MQQDVPHQDIRTLRCNRMSHIKISAHFDETGCSTSRYPYITTGCPTSRYPYITMQQDAPHQDIRKLRCNRMSHIKISAHFNATGCSTSRYPYITMQQDVPHKDIRTLRCNRMSHIKISAHFNATGCST